MKNFKSAFLKPVTTSRVPNNRYINVILETNNRDAIKIIADWLQQIWQMFRQYSEI